MPGGAQTGDRQEKFAAHVFTTTNPVGSPIQLDLSGPNLTISAHLPRDSVRSGAILEPNHPDLLDALIPPESTVGPEMSPPAGRIRRISAGAGPIRSAGAPLNI